MKKKLKLDKFHYHEALDRCYIVANIIEDLLIEHPVISKNKFLRKKIRKSQKNIMKAYTKIGGMY